MSPTTPRLDQPQVPLPDGYHLAELDASVDRDAMLEVAQWSFVYEIPPEDAPYLVWPLEPGRSVGIWRTAAGGRRLAAVHSSFAFRLQLPGGSRVPAAGLTWVAVHPGERRRGLARAMMHAHLQRSIDRGEIVSVLDAAESGIYGRYGYGIASHRTSATLGRATPLRTVAGSEDLVVELATLDPAAHGAMIESLHGSVSRPGWIT